jgi:hypothetical protein
MVTVIIFSKIEWIHDIVVMDSIVSWKLELHRSLLKFSLN